RLCSSPIRRQHVILIVCPLPTPDRTHPPMMLKKTITLALLTLAAAVMLASAAAAAPREEHYQIQVPVDGQGDAERERAIRTGLAKVLVRISGREDISQQPKVAGLLAEAGRFV